MQNNVPAIKIGNHLIEAYKGHYEDDREQFRLFKEYTKVEVATEDQYNEWLTTIKIIQDTPKERLRVYCEWEGILGYSSTLYDIATGKL